MKKLGWLHILLLIYVVAAILFWGVNLQRQNLAIADNERALVMANGGELDSDDLQQQYREIAERQNTRTMQYIGEGAAFLLVIVIGTLTVYSSYRRQKKLSTQQNNFMLSITHELKSPLAGIKLNLQTLLRPQLKAEQQAMVIGRAVRETDRLNELCNNLLLAARMEGQGLNINAERIDISALVADIIELYSARSTHELREDIQAGCYTIGDDMLWRLAIGNLLENAIKYSPATEPIDIMVKQEDSNIYVSVADGGVGISDEEKQKVYEKFYRVGNEDSRSTTGTGLGLYLVSSIAQQHQATISVIDRVPKGSVFELRMEAAV